MEMADGLMTVVADRDGLDGMEMGPEGKRPSTVGVSLPPKGRAKSVEEVEKAFVERNDGDTDEELLAAGADAGCK